MYFRKLWIRALEVYDDLRGSGRKWQTLDSVSVKVPCGMHRVLVVDQKGVPLSVTIIPDANIHDMNASTIANVTLTNTISC